MPAPRWGVLGSGQGVFGQEGAAACLSAPRGTLWWVQLWPLVPTSPSWLHLVPCVQQVVVSWGAVVSWLTLRLQSVTVC